MIMILYLLWIQGLFNVKGDKVMVLIYQLYRSGKFFLLKETGDNHQPAASHWQTLSHNVASSTPCHEWDSNLQL